MLYKFSNILWYRGASNMIQIFLPKLAF